MKFGFNFNSCLEIIKSGVVFQQNCVILLYYACKLKIFEAGLTHSSLVYEIFYATFLFAYLQYEVTFKPRGDLFYECIKAI